MKFLPTLLLLSLLYASETQAQVLKADGNQRWFKGNMHTHSLWSDGDDYPEVIGAWYRDHGYQFLVYTDHNVLHQGERWISVDRNGSGQKALDRLKKQYPGDWVETRTRDEKLQVRLKTFDQVFERLARPQKYLLIQGEEITDRFGNAPVHMCATNTKTLLPPLHGDSVADVMQRNFRAAIAHRERTGQKTLVHLNHPNFGWGVTAEDMMRIEGENFFEVFNGHPTVRDSGDRTHASTERMWDIINTMRLTKYDLPVLYGLATDDGHNYHQTAPGQGSQPGRGWVNVLADSLTPDKLVEALEAGRFYSSSGVTLNAIEANAKGLSVEITAQKDVTYTIDFIGTMSGTDTSSKPAVEDEQAAARQTRVYSDDVGRILKTVTGNSATYEFTGNEVYVRARVTSSLKHPNPSEVGEFQKAWVQPVIVHKKAAE